MHKAYFDILREQLNADPPEYKQALVLLEDVKQVFIIDVLLYIYENLTPM